MLALGAVPRVEAGGFLGTGTVQQALTLSTLGINGATGVAVSPDGLYVYVSSRRDDAVGVFSTTGGLTFVEFQQDGLGGVDGLKNASGVAVSPDGNHVYATGEVDDAVAVFGRNVVTGALTFVEQQKDSVGLVVNMRRPQAVVISPDDLHVYVASQTDDAVVVFSRNLGTGALTFVESQKDQQGGVDGMNSPQSVAISPDGLHVYVPARQSVAGNTFGSIVVFSRNVVTGALTFVEVQRDELNGVAGLIPRVGSVAVSPDGNHVYAASQGGSTVVAFSRNVVTGALTFVEFLKGGGANDGLKGARSVTVSPDNAYVYFAAADDKKASVFRRDLTTGRLRPLEAIDTFLPPLFTGDIFGGAASVTTSPDGLTLYVASTGGNSVAALDIDVCANGLVRGDEQCDDGDLFSGDGCSATCRIELCPAAPVGGCKVPTVTQKAQLQIKDYPYPFDAKDKVQWKWTSGQLTNLVDYGTPTASATYVLCVYDSSGNPQPLMSRAAPAGGTCAGKACWGSSPTSYKYGDKILTPDGLQQVQLVQGLVDGAAKIKFKGKGVNLEPALPFVPPVTVQVFNTDTSVCWSAIYTTFIANDGLQYKAKSD
ncbi:MAG: beta-propeller fold lactonase family protein [Candidatus Binatia bacterium]